MSKLQMTSLAATLAATLVCASLGRAQDPAKPPDEALERLLEKLDGNREKPEGAKGDQPVDRKKAGEVAPRDKDLDSLLEKLGQTTDAPTPEDPAKGAGGGPKPETPPDPAQPGKPKADDLKGEAKGLDEHLEELTGRRSKKDKSKGQGEASGPLSRVIKEMRDVEERLGKTDTGDETRKRQAQIVKNLETLIDELRESQSQSKSQAKKKAQLSMKPANGPGSKKEGKEQGAMAKGVGPSKPEKPTDKHSLAGGKDEWGHLPPELRQQMVNIFKEEGLPHKAEQIRRYYLSLSKKILTREE